MPDDVVLATIPDDLRRRYLDEGLWDDSSLSALLTGDLRANPAAKQSTTVHTFDID